MNKHKENLREKARVVFILVLGVIGPIILEISNQLSGSWTNEDGRINLGIGKIITILLGLAYIIILVTTSLKELNERTKIEKLKIEIEEKKEVVQNYRDVVESIENLIDFTSNTIKNQISYFKNNKKIDIRNFNIENFSTQICELIYNNIRKNSEYGKDITVNIYIKEITGKKEFTKMIAHEGHISNPKFFGKQKMLIKRKQNYFCEKIFINNNPENIYKLSKPEVAKAFSLQEDGCKYNQYIALPITRIGDNIIALIEINAHNDTIITKDKDTAIDLVKNYYDVYKSYLLMIDKMENYLELIANTIIEEKQYER